MTFGRGVPLELTWPGRLEASLNAAARGGTRYEVLNFGVGGYNTAQAVEQYDALASEYDPDAIVLAYVLNDPLDPTLMLRWLEANPERSAPEAAPAEGPGAGSRLLHLLAERVRELRRGRPETRVPSNVSRLHRETPSWSIVTKGFGRLAALAAEDGIPVFVFIVPMLVDFDGYPFDAIHAKVAAEARRNGFGVLDALATLRGHDGERLQLTPGDPTHPSAEGYALLAAALHEALSADGLLDGTRRKSSRRDRR